MIATAPDQVNLANGLLNLIKELVTRGEDM
jgi:hypothetical protein